MFGSKGAAEPPARSVPARSVPRTPRLVVLVFLLVSGLVGSTAPLASAATSYGGTATGEISMSRWVPRSGTVCKITAYYERSAGTGIRVKGRGNCAADITAPGYPAVIGDVEVQGDLGGGTLNCGGSQSNVPVTKDGGGSTTWTIGAKGPGTFNFSVGLTDAQCSVNRVCISDYRVERDNFFDAAYSGRYCAPLALGDKPGESVSRSCEYGKVSRPEVRSRGWKQLLPIGSRSNFGYSWTGMTKIEQTAIPPRGNQSIQWVPYLVWESIDGSIDKQVANGRGGPARQILADVSSTGTRLGITDWSGTTPSGTSINLLWDQDAGPGGPVDLFADPAPAGYVPTGKVVGAGVFYLWDVSDPNSASEPSGYREPLQTSPSTGRFGRNDPSVCSFYWGKKIADVSGTTADEPGGGLPLETPAETGSSGEPNLDDAPKPEDPAEGCSFSATDPSSWLAGGMCAAVGLLGGILDVLAGIAQGIAGLASAISGAIAGALSGIVGGILDGIAALFIPSDGAMRDVGSDLSDKWGDSTVGLWSAAATRLVPAGAVDGCEGPRLAFEVFGVDVDARPFSACSGWAATAAGVVRTAMSVFLVAGAFFASLRGIGSGFGWSPGVGEKV